MNEISSRQRVSRTFRFEETDRIPYDLMESVVWPEIRRNIDAFSRCGGYVLANSHHRIANIRPENIVAMLQEAREYRL